ncbi:MAG TPA: TlpA disulfide reductase family protein [Opitutaceae bacterium]|nr:TlpA disulfide reductase family protein [Opitutaceae bacterium]
MKPALLLAVAALCLAAAPGAPLRAEPVTPVPAPAWTLKDLDGKAVTSDQFKGKVVVVDFWATWCAPCRREIPGYVDLQKKYASEGLVFVGISVDEDGPEVVRKFVKDHAINYTIVMADEAVVNAFAPIDGYPTTYIIDRDGLIRDKKLGSRPTADYEKEILAVLKRPAS